MTEPQPSPLALRLALRLYPAAYRAEHAEELTTTLRDVTADAPQAERLREYASLTGTALRMRAGLGRAGFPGQVLAQAAPLTAAIAVGSQLLYLLVIGHRIVENRWDWTQPGDSLTGRLWAVDQFLALPLLWIMALAAAFAKRWGAFRLLALLASANVAALALTHHDAVILGRVAPTNAWTALAGLLSVMLVLAPPRELLEAVRWQKLALTAVTLGAVLTFFLPLLTHLFVGFLESFFGVWASGAAVEIAIAAAALGFVAVVLIWLWRHPDRVSGLALAALPSAVGGYLPFVAESAYGPIAIIIALVLSPVAVTVLRRRGAPIQPT